MNQKPTTYASSPFILSQVQKLNGSCSRGEQPNKAALAFITSTSQTRYYLLCNACPNLDQ